MIMQKQAYSIEEAAQILDVHPDTIRRMIKRGELFATKIGKNYRIPLSEIDRLLGRGPQRSSPDNQ
jgi:putative molybdopterin biosynthesis protein